MMQSSSRTVRALPDPIERRLALGSIALAFGMAVTVGTAIGFERIGGYIPCMLCLEQRTPYYVGIPLAAASAVIALRGGSKPLVRAMLLLSGAIMLYSLYLGAFHAGVEWNWWLGPPDCGLVVAPDTGGAGILDAINTQIPPSCNAAPLRVLGLSFAGWNAAASLLLAALAFYGAASGREAGKSNG